MRALIFSGVISLYFISNTVFADDEIFGEWKIFPGPNPGIVDLFPDSNRHEAFQIGQIIFDYPRDEMAEDDQPVKEFSKLHSVADILKRATPGPAVNALVKQQLTIPHMYHFESATVLNRGDRGLMWSIVYLLFPEEGGFSGIPFQYQAVLDGHGNLIQPRITVFDCYLHSPDEGWTSSTLTLPTTPPAKDKVLQAEQIRSLATESLNKKSKNPEAALTARRRFVYQSQKLIRIPVATDAAGKLILAEIWAVNFQDNCEFRKQVKEERPHEVFTVWVTKDGQTATIRHIDHY